MTDVIYADQVCYLNDANDINQAHAVCFGIANAVKLYQKTFLYTNYDQINAETTLIKDSIARGMTISDIGFPRMPYKTQLIIESNMDNFLIGTFFEVVAKAFVLNEGLLVHKIKSSRSAPQSVRDFAKDQATIPVDAGIYIAHDPFADYKSVGRNGLQYLKDETINYSWLYKGGYLAALPFSSDFCNDANVFRVLRNQIHFPLAGASESVIGLSNTSDDTHQTIMNEIRQTIKPLFDKLIIEHKFNFPPLAV